MPQCVCKRGWCLHRRWAPLICRNLRTFYKKPWEQMYSNQSPPPPHVGRDATGRLHGYTKINTLLMNRKTNKNTFLEKWLLIVKAMVFFMSLLAMEKQKPCDYWLSVPSSRPLRTAMMWVHPHSYCSLAKFPFFSFCLFLISIELILYNVFWSLFRHCGSFHRTCICSSHPGGCWPGLPSLTKKLSVLGTS